MRTKEENKKYMKEYREANKEELKIKRNKSDKKYREANKEKAKEYYLNNKESIAIIKNVWYEANKELIFKRQNKYFNKRRKEDPIFRMSKNVRCRLNEFMKQNGFRKTSKTFEMIGCSPAELRVHIEKQFTPGMTLDKLGLEIHIDHIKPLALATCEEDLIQLCHYTNLQPLWAKDNLTKGCKF